MVEGLPVYSATIISVHKSSINELINDNVSDSSSSTGSLPIIYLPEGILPFESF
nr:MAG TPA: hypothetical protein [Caudoviricetes sp.]